jgi:dolichol-phosphate mannosyltransferase
VVVPVFQNADNLPTTIPRLLALDSEIAGIELEVVLVDDGSTDGSWELLGAAHRDNPDRVKVVRLTRNFGQTPAVQAGLRHASGDVAVVISADLQEPPEKIAEMVARWREGAKFVVAFRGERAESTRHSIIHGLYWKLVRRYGIRDFPASGYDFCLLDRQVIDDVNRLDERNTSIFPLIYWLGYTPVMMPIRREVRTAGRSQWHLLKKVRLTLDTLIGFTYLPVRAITYSALAAGMGAAAYLLFLLIRYLILRSPVPGWTSTIAVILTLGSMTLFALGIICEYIWRILDEARARPPFVVDRVLDATSASPAGVEDRPSR